METNSRDSVIMEKMTKVIDEVLKTGATPLTPEKRFIEDLRADSLDKISLLMALEQEFETTISDEEAKGFTTVGAVFEYIKSRQDLRQS